MKNILSLLVIVFTLATLATINLYADSIYIGTPSYGGNGCPAGSASATLSPDSKQLSILFDSFMAEAGSNGKMLERKSCNVAIPVHVPQGFSVSVLKIDYRGFVSIPVGGQGQFNVEYFFAGQKGPAFRKTFVGGTESDYTLTNTLGVQALIWSPCGKDVNLRVNASTLAKSNRYYEDALATVDSMDVDAGIVYLFQWRQCR